jgi:hypothetical protein
MALSAISFCSAALVYRSTSERDLWPEMAIPHYGLGLIIAVLIITN